eukprot:TRINITY_DN72470_c0_g1_i1.p1 TRINITY_DN72470_c0_g1~~TRINITY_DN72470_c0_g1_i1.p1  ORF type:complete len:203 (+),score=55.22 TRINITY_DN72470_c0_g1_i1:65-673(+)
MAAGVHYFENGHPSTKEAYESWGGSDSFSWSDMLGDTLLTPSGEKKTNEALSGKKQVALLFSGSWCPWCRAFEPMMQDVYDKVKAKDASDTEVVYLSVDADEAKFKEVMAGKTWTAVPYNRAQGNGETPIGFIRKKHRQELGKPMGTLQEKWKLGSVPSIIVLDSKGKLITDDIRKELGDEPEDGVEFTATTPASWLEAMGA